MLPTLLAAVALLSGTRSLDRDRGSTDFPARPAVVPVVKVAHIHRMAFDLLGLMPGKAQDGAKVYKQVVPSVVWVHSTRDRGLATGSGTLIDKERRLILTNYHVVQDNPNAKVFFPVFRDGKPIAEKEYYLARRNRLGIPGKVIALDKKADLALIRIDAVAKDVEAVPLAADSPDSGADTHTIGNAGASGALFGYVKGTVRQVYRKKWAAELEPRKVANFDAKVVETDSPTNPGDSGGPLLNDKGDLIGVTQGGAIKAQQLSTFIDVSEVKKLLTARAVKDIRAEKPVVRVVREKALPVADGAKLFKDETVAVASEALADLFQKDIDVMVETHAKAPENRYEEVKAATPAERTRLFREWTRNRMDKQGVNSIGILISNDPKSLYVEVSADAAKQYPEGFAAQLRDALIKGLKVGKPDDGLKDAIKLIQENRGKSKE